MKSKLHVLLVLCIFLITPFYISAQNAPSTNVGTSSVSTDQTNIQPDALIFLKTLEAPKIIKNSIRIKNIRITKFELNSSNKIVIEGTVDINNYGTSKTSKLYMSSFTGIKGDQGYYLQYPLYNQSKTESFILEPKQTVTKSFSIIEKNFLNYGKAAVEIWVTDEYDKRNHASIAHIPNEFAIQKETRGNLFTDFMAQIIVGDQKFIPSNGPTFYPETEDMSINFSSDSLDFSTLNSAHVQIFERSFFTPSIREFDYSVSLEDKNKKQFNIQIPKDLKPGVYPFSVGLTSNDSNIFVPHTYGRFIIGGNMAKVTDVTLKSDEENVQGLTLAVQGNPQDIVDPDREQSVVFGAEVFVFDKHDKILFTQKIENQSVSIYRNIEIDFTEAIKTGKITKVKVELSNNKGIFNTYNKEFTYDKKFNLWYMVFGIVSLSITVFIIFLLRKRRRSIANITFLILSCFFTYQADAGMTPTPSNHFGAFTYDAYAVEVQPENSINCPSGCSGVDSIEPILSKDETDIQRFEEDSLLDYFGINISLEEPVTVAVDPSYCYAPGQVIPVVFTYEYGICSNSPSTSCTGNFCGTLGATSTTSVDEYADIYLTLNSGDWYWNLRNWEVDTANLNDPSYFGASMESLGSDTYKQFDIDYLYDYVGQLENQSVGENLYIDGNGATKSTNLQLTNINDARIAEIEEKILRPTTSYSEAIPIDVSGFNANGSFDYSLTAPEKPGIYNFYTSMSFEAKYGGTGYYIAQHQISVCNTLHDADYVMPGKQYIDSNGDFKDENGTTLSGYMMQLYPILPAVINNASLSGSDDDNDGDIDSTTGEVDGYIESPYNEFNFVTVGNYCGYKDLSAWSGGSNFLTNEWVNYYTNATDLSQKIGWFGIFDFIAKIPDSRTLIPVSGFYDNGTRYFATNGTSSPTYKDLSNYSSGYDYIVQKEGTEFKFINLQDSFLPQTGSWIIETALKLEDLIYVPKLTFAEMLSGGMFNSAYISSSINNTSNTFLIKEDLVYYNSYSTCALYEDFCPSVAGIQYLVEYGTSMRLMYINSNGVHGFASSTSYSAPIATVNAMCAAVPATTFSATCSVETPLDPEDRNPNTEIKFNVVPTNVDSNFSTTYAWTGATVMSGYNMKATTTYTTTGSKTNVSVQVTNGPSVVTASCPVDIVATPITASCSAPSVTLPSPSTYTASINPSSGSYTYQWKTSTGTNISGETGVTYTTTYGTVGSYTKKVTITSSTTGASSTASCVATVTSSTPPVGTPTLTRFRFNPYIAPPTTNVCKVELEIDNVSSCSVGPTDIPASGGVIDISTIDGVTVPVGTHELSCVSFDETTTGTYGTPQKCISNPSSKED